MEFSWDPRKDLLNQKNHEVLSFQVAKLVFDDPNHILKRDRIDEYGEQRWHAIGLVGKTVLVAVHVYRLENGKEIIRIILAREADRNEYRKYFR